MGKVRGSLVVDRCDSVSLIDSLAASLRVAMSHNIPSIKDFFPTAVIPTSSTNKKQQITNNDQPTTNALTPHLGTNLGVSSMGFSVSAETRWSGRPRPGIMGGAGTSSADVITGGSTGLPSATLASLTAAIALMVSPPRTA